MNCQNSFVYRVTFRSYLINTPYRSKHTKAPSVPRVTSLSQSVYEITSNYFIFLLLTYYFLLLLRMQHPKQSESIKRGDREP